MKYFFTILFLLFASPVFATVTTVYPDPSVESTSVDGFSQSNLGAGSTWAANHDAASGTGTDDSGTAMEIESMEQAGESARFEIERAFFLFDTSAITDTDVVSSATLSLATLLIINTDDDGLDYVNIYTTTPAANTAIANADYDQIGTTAQATAIDFGSLAAAGNYTDFTLNATGISSITLTGITKFGGREGHDVENTSITTDTRNLWQVSSADTALTTLDPKLVITHGAAASPTASPIDALLWD